MIQETSENREQREQKRKRTNKYFTVEKKTKFSEHESTTTSSSPHFTDLYGHYIFLRTSNLPTIYQQFNNKVSFKFFQHKF